MLNYVKPKVPRTPLSEQELTAMLARVVELDLALQDAAKHTEHLSGSASMTLHKAEHGTDQMFDLIKALVIQFDGTEQSPHPPVPGSDPAQIELLALIQSLLGSLETTQASSNIESAAAQIDAKTQAYLDQLHRLLSTPNQPEPELKVQELTSQAPANEERSIHHADLLRQMADSAERSTRIDHAAFGGGNLGAAGISAVELSEHFRPRGRNLSQLAKLIEEAVGLEAAKKADEFIRRSSVFTVRN